jgi:hypothetical protein
MEASKLEKYFPSQNISNVIAATMGLQSLGYGKSESIASTLLRSPSSEEKYAQEVARKYYYLDTEKMPFLKGRSGVITYLIQVEYPGLQDESIATTSTAPKLLLAHEDSGPTRERGVFCPKYHRKTLFSQPVTFKTADLPRWKPKIVIDRRTLER